MKRSDPLKVYGVRSSHVFSNLDQHQLTMIGAVAMAYNDAEDMLDQLCETGLDLPIVAREVLGRINGTDGKIEIAKQAAKVAGFDETEMKALADSLGRDGFAYLKTLRDAVIHARVFDIGTGVGKTPHKRGKVADVLLSLLALGGLYERLVLVGWELRELEGILVRRQRIKKGGLDDQHREQLESETRDEFARYQSHRNRRRSLQSLPEFPPDTPNLLPQDSPPTKKGAN